ncbi:alpha-galactosylglucosyldiacylglycerol synthase [Bacteroidaceae bacterium]|nr:alpha-galactosylglucosyldiacylglycerol synthase [Bacteroidaceae bacterium]
MKRIFIINNHFGSAAQYGIKTFLEQLLNSLRNTDFHITMVELCSSSPLLHAECQNGIEYLHIPMIPNFTKENNDIYCRNAAYILLTFIEPEDECTFHFNFLHHKLLAETLRKIYPQGKQILTIHYFEWLFDLKGDVSSFRRIIQSGGHDLLQEEAGIYEHYLWDKAFFQAMDYIVALCGETYHILCNVYQISTGKVRVIPNGMQDEYHPLSNEERHKMKADFGFADTDRLILFVGRVTQMKGIGILIESMKKIISEDSHVHLILAGRGEEGVFKKMTVGYWKNIHFIGQVDKGIVSQLYQIADLGVLPSFHEQCSCVAIEMMMFDLPFIATRCGRLNDIPLSDNLLEYMMEKPDSNILLDKIKNQLGKEEAKNEFRECYLQCFHIDNLKAYMQLY